MSKSYFLRMEAEASSSNRVSTATAETFLNDKVLANIEGLLAAIEAAISKHDQPRARSVEEYEQDVCAEFSALAAGDTYTLISGPPPLERDRSRVRAAAVRAAFNNVRIRYYYPATPAHEPWCAPIYGQPQPTGAFSKVFDELAAWLRQSDEVVLNIMRALYTEAESCDLQNALVTGRHEKTYREQLVANVAFWSLQHLPVSPNEKLVWVSGPVRTAQPRALRKEILAADEITDGCSIYGDRQRWLSRPFPFPFEALKFYLRQFRGKSKIDWALVTGFVGGAPTA
ncbi:MAG: hypothetical protein HZA52_13070 [Planctomycetes bacterium]|nr:hypothetical protein [Planctomycetota bacterium]